MRKNRIILLIIIFFVFAFFVGHYIKNIMSQDRIRRAMISDVYYALLSSCVSLDDLLGGVEKNGTINNENMADIIRISHPFIIADTLLKQYKDYFPAKKLIYGNSIVEFIPIIPYGATFGSIANLITIGNDYIYSITADNIISENELLCLTILRDDVSLIVDAMSFDENQLLRVNKNLTVSELNKILDTFFSKWSIQNENSPIKLLSPE